MIFRYLFKWKSFLIFLFFLYVLSNIIVNADDSNELRVDNNNKREVLPESNTPAERAEIVEVAKVADQVDEKAESQLVRVEAEDPDLVGSVLDINLKEANEVQAGIKPSVPILELEDTKALLISTLMIVASEIGDKTFFIAAIMAMKNSRFLVFSAAFCSLILMSVLSAALGYVLPNLIPRQYMNYLASLLFLSFGIKMAYEGYNMSGEEAEHEMEEISSELKEKDDIDRIESAETGGLTDETKHSGFKEGFVNLCQFIFSPVFVQTFILTFLAEWGDRSQIATIALAAAQNVYLVTMGVIVGHSFCTGLAVIGGKFLAERISVKTVTIIGSILFISFSILYFYEEVTGAN
ncbi:hypothetical protein RclHR1_01400017 [Rhizophagus clarus]|uniref:GDT1 family protein n=1 Tax=Rhizophagus clarus TaxID=94130 RepID=A0A2Z6QRB5_9GLOM|nr:hypothetical protein RclHR1_01400017 [Rhizophagus clarus]GES95882.1 vacuole protein [Rhizophagus clarus]